METYDAVDEPVMLSPTGKRKRRRPRSSARSIAKTARYSGKGLIPRLTCTHKNALCTAGTLNENDLAYIKGQLYVTKDKVEQDAILVSHMDIGQVKRRRQRDPRDKDEGRQKNRRVLIKYSLLKEDKTKISVCQASFLSIFCVKEFRVQSAARYWLEHGRSRPENRGGYRRAAEYEGKKERIRNHIKSFTCRASHYARRGAPRRKYLPSDLSVAKMHKMFQKQNHDQVTYSLYWSIFVYDFNLAFGHPATDVCSTCLKFRIAIRDTEQTPDEKQEKILLYTLHRRRARQFYNKMNEVGDSFIVCFDVMENLVLPKSPVGQAYYSRQLYLYVFGIVHHRGRGESQRKEDIHLYTWLEHQNAKDSNTIASALHNYLGSVVISDIRQIELLRLFSDSCYGQKKNINVLCMLFALCNNKYPNLTIDYHFPIKGHSFLPADRVFGRIEQEIRKKDTILMPEEYHEIISKHGTVHVYGKDWKCYDYKAVNQFHKKSEIFQNQ
ncbi:uncharacterized protein LOC121378605 [Gigantopelta aegis]|uniref:uncharacterized protein LOC121378605 n=1 Tax=Gigantopelta aegis TaxID=1735272 RepID=UPI001B88B779|nr:uncharacterized protein LOC121378605 [Gigantopelta aegis]